MDRTADMFLRHPMVVAIVAPLTVALVLAAAGALWRIVRAVTRDLPDAIERVSKRLDDHMAAEETEAEDRQRWRYEIEQKVNEVAEKVQTIEDHVKGTP